MIARSGEDSRSSPNEEGEIVFKSLENGKKICSPLIDEEFSDLVVEEGNDERRSHVQSGMRVVQSAHESWSGSVENALNVCSR